MAFTSVLHNHMPSLFSVLIPLCGKTKYNANLIYHPDDSL